MCERIAARNLSKTGNMTTEHAYQDEKYTVAIHRFAVFAAARGEAYVV